MENTNSNHIPNLRQDLRFILQESAEGSYVVEDPLRQKFYRIGSAEYVFFTQMIGELSLPELCAKTNQLLGEEIYDLQSSQLVINWLQQNQLLVDDLEGGACERQASDKSAEKQKLLSKFNLLAIKIPLLNPDRIFLFLSKWMNWLTGPFFGLLWLAIIGYAISDITTHWSDFTKTATSVLSPSNVFFLWLAWFILKILHELFHGLVCYRYGGRVYEAGILFILFFPLTYLNASASWGFPRKWQRIHTAFAGVYVELFVAALAVIFWVGNQESISGIFAHNIILVAGFSSLVFNLNPLMRFDGYFILTDLLGLPNLYGRGREFVGSIFSYIFFREWNYLQRFSPGKELLIACYGICSWGWRILVVTFLVVCVATMLHGFGLFIAIISAAILLGPPLWRLKDKISLLYRERIQDFWYFILMLAGISVGLFLALHFFTWKGMISVPAVVQYERELLVRSGINGIIEEIFIDDSRSVEAGDPLIRLGNTELFSEVNQLNLFLAKLSLQKRNSLLKEDLTSYQVQEEQERVAVAKLKALEKDIIALAVYAPQPGAVLLQNLDQRLGTYLKKGEEIVTLVSENHKKIVASVGQDEIVSFRQSFQQKMKVKVTRRSMGRLSFYATISHVSPRADNRIPDDVFNAAYGGPIAVRGKSRQAELSSGQEQRDDYEFFTPRFLVELEVPPKEVDSILVGQLITVSVAGQSMSYWQLIKNRLINYFGKRLENK